MNFYQELSRHYDAIFATSAEEMRFIRRLIPENAAVLDIGCGTGNKTVYFSDKAASVDAVDLDSGMIARAVSAHGRANVRYAVLDMRLVDKAFAGRFFGAVVCLGNTLVHLLSPGAILDLLAKIRSLLAKDGVFIVQILNYDRARAQNITELPPIETPEVRFLRRYVWEDGALRFITVLKIKHSGETLENDIPLYPLGKEELTNLLLQAGFGEPEYFGSYQGDAHGDDSFVTIACCRSS